MPIGFNSRDQERSDRMKSHRRATATVCAILGLALALAGCGTGKSEKAGFLRIGTTYFVDSLNPFVGSSGMSYTIWEYTYPHLDQYDTVTSALVPSYAKSWSHSADGLTWTFHLQPNWHWSDGTLITAADAAWTINTNIKYASTATADNAGYVTGVRSATAPDSTTLVLHMSHVTTPSLLLSNLQELQILPEQVWGKYAVGNGLKLKSVTGIPVSGGPFVLTSYVANSVVTLGLNPKWSGQKPHISGWGVQDFSDTSALIEALESGSIDYVYRGLDPTVVAQLKAKGLHVEVPPATSMLALSINSAHDKSHPELKSLQVRQAFDYAIDRQAMAKTAFLGTVQPVEGSLAVAGTGDAPGTSLPWLSPSIHVTSFNLAKANALLNEAGYKRGAGGIRVANGHPMAYTVIVEQQIGGPGLRLFTILQNDFAKIGVKLTPSTLDYTTALNAVFAQHYSNWDMLIDSNGGPVDPDFMLTSFSCSNFGVFNNAGYCNKSYDKLLQAEDAAPTTAQRVQLIWRLEQMFDGAKTYIGMVSQPNLSAWDKKFTGYVRGPGGDIFFLSMQSLLNLEPAQ